MHPKTDRLLELYRDQDLRCTELAKHSMLMEDGLRAALRELDRVNDVKDGHPLVSHNLMYNLRGRLEV